MLNQRTENDSLKIITQEDDVFENNYDDVVVDPNEYEVKQKVKDFDFTNSQLCFCTSKFSLHSKVY